MVAIPPNPTDNQELTVLYSQSEIIRKIIKLTDIGWLITLFFIV